MIMIWYIFNFQTCQIETFFFFFFLLQQNSNANIWWKLIGFIILIILLSLFSYGILFFLTGSNWSADANQFCL